MRLPELKVTKDNVTVLNSFMGVNKGLHIQESEFEDMTNMSNDYFPVIANRRKRGIMGKLNNPLGVCGGDKLSYIDTVTTTVDDVETSTDYLYIDDALVTAVTLDPDHQGEKRQMVMMGAYLCIFPDGIIYNTSDSTADVVSISNKTTTTDTVTMHMCKLDGTVFVDDAHSSIGTVNTYVGDTEPSTDTYTYWMDTSSDTVILKMYSSNYSMWTSVATTYIKIQATGIGKGLNAYDSVRLSGIATKGYNDTDFNYDKDKGNTYIVYKCEDDYIMIAGLMDIYYTQSTAVTVERYLPTLDYICELDNRLWGCNSMKHEIYACKQGSPWNWEAYAGLDSDSYAATVGTQGDFTGIAAYSGYVFFFKEDGFHKLYGTKPSNYEMVWKPCRGVAKGCSDSIAIVDEILFYKSRDAIVAYDGSSETISDALGIEPMYDAIAAGYRNKYYCSMRDVDYNYRLYVYDVTKGAWCIEDAIKAKYLVYANQATYLIDEENNVYVINNEVIYEKYFPMQTDLGDEYCYPSETLYVGNIIKGAMEDTFSWSLTTGDLGLDNPYSKYLKRVNIRYMMDTDATLKIEVQYDSSGTWDYVTEYTATAKKSYEIPIAVKRADHVKLRLSGTGDFQLYSIAKVVESGSGETNGTN